jgi:hypothetical protein
MTPAEIGYSTDLTLVQGCERKHRVCGEGIVEPVNLELA